MEMNICEYFAKFTKRAEMHLGRLQLQEKLADHQNDEKPVTV